MTTQSETNGSAQPIIKCESVYKIFGDNANKVLENSKGIVNAEAFLEAGCVVGVNDASFEVHEGELLILMGLSGSGKSTLLRCISRLTEPTAGKVFIDGENVLEMNSKELIELRRNKMGMVFQSFGLLPHKTVLENIAFPLQVKGISTGESIKRAMEMVDLVSLGGRENYFPRQLSGGQQQRVGIARSLAVEPDIWFLDEPFSALDPLIRKEMQDEFLRLQGVLHKTILFVTHDFNEALRLADRIAIMKDGQVVQIGTPADLVMHPADGYVAEFTKDVPRVRIITAGEIVDTGKSRDGLTQHVDAGATLEAIMPRFNASPEGLVVDQDGQGIGVVTPQLVVNALAAAPDQN